MPNKERVFFEGAIYHVWLRGNNKNSIFKEDENKLYFINQLKEYNKKFDFSLLSYVVMDTHYHLLIQTFKDSISEVMFYINNDTGKYLKNKLNHTGHIFEGRFSSKVVRTKKNFLWLIRYIHRNPVEANICYNVDEYKWSSHELYIKGSSDFLNTDFPLSIFDSDKIKAKELYLKLVTYHCLDQSGEKDYELFYKSLNQYNGINIFANMNEELRKISKSDFNQRSSLDDIIKSLNVSQEDMKLLSSGSRKRYLTNLKIDFIKKALAEKYTLIEIGDYLKVTQSAITKLINKK